MEAINNDSPGIAKFLVEKGVNINNANQGGMTALMLAAGGSNLPPDQTGHTGNLEIVKYLIEKGADINKITRDGLTAVIFAAGTGNLELVRYLVGKGAVIKAKPNYPTALISAVMADHLDIVKYLVEKGADINAKNKGGQSALIMAQENGNKEIVNYLKSLAKTE
jgi:ankyrin repeat protein